MVSKAKSKTLNELTRERGLRGDGFRNYAEGIKALEDSYSQTSGSGNYEQRLSAQKQILYNVTEIATGRGKSHVRRVSELGEYLSKNESKIKDNSVLKRYIVNMINLERDQVMGVKNSSKQRVYDLAKEVKGISRGQENISNAIGYLEKAKEELSGVDSREYGISRLTKSIEKRMEDLSTNSVYVSRNASVGRKKRSLHNSAKVAKELTKLRMQYGERNVDQIKKVEDAVYRLQDARSLENRLIRPDSIQELPPGHSSIGEEPRESEETFKFVSIDRGNRKRTLAAAAVIGAGLFVAGGIAGYFTSGSDKTPKNSEVKFSTVIPAKTQPSLAVKPTTQNNVQVSDTGYAFTNRPMSIPGYNSVSVNLRGLENAALESLESMIERGQEVASEISDLRARIHRDENIAVKAAGIVGSMGNQGNSDISDLGSGLSLGPKSLTVQDKLGSSAPRNHSGHGSATQPKSPQTQGSTFMNTLRDLHNKTKQNSVSVGEAIYRMESFTRTPAVPTEIILQDGRIVGRVSAPYQGSNGLTDTEGELMDQVNAVASIYHPQKLIPNAFETVAEAAGMPNKEIKKLEKENEKKLNLWAQFGTLMRNARGHGRNFIRVVGKNGKQTIYGDQNNINKLVRRVLE